MLSPRTSRFTDNEYGPLSSDTHYTKDSFFSCSIIVPEREEDKEAYVHFEYIKKR